MNFLSVTECLNQNISDSLFLRATNRPNLRTARKFSGWRIAPRRPSCFRLFRSSVRPEHLRESA